MQNNRQKLFYYLNSPELPDDLLDKTMHRIQRCQVQAACLRLSGFILLFIGSIAAFIPAWKLALAGFAESGFCQFLSLIYSSAGAVLANWKFCLLSLLESLPAVEIAALFIVVLVFLLSLKFSVKNFKIAFQLKTNII